MRRFTFTYQTWNLSKFNYNKFTKDIVANKIEGEGLVIKSSIVELINKAVIFEVNFILKMMVIKTIQCFSQFTDILKRLVILIIFNHGNLKVV